MKLGFALFAALAIWRWLIYRSADATTELGYLTMAVLILAGHPCQVRRTMSSAG